MPRFLESGVTGILRSRWGVAVVIGVIVAGVVGIGRLVSGESSSSVSNAPPATVVTVDPADEDGMLGSEPPPTPSTVPGRAVPEAVAYAFASAWADHQGVDAKTWRDRLLPNATADLADELTDVDPAGVPADRVLERPSIVPLSATVTTAVVKMDSGTLSLRMSAPDGHWLVDGIDWAAS